MEVNNSAAPVNTNGGNFHQGDVNNTVNYYLSENKSIKDLTKKLKDINTKLSKENIDADFKQHLELQKYELECEYNKRYKAIEQAYHDILKFGFTDEELKELQELFLEGRHQEIEEKVNPKAIEESIKIRKEANKKDANKLLILAKSTAIQFENEDRFEKTIEYFELSLKADRNGENLFYYALFLQEHNKNQEAIPFYNEALSLSEKLTVAESQSHLANMTGILINLANLYSQINEIEKAVEHYGKSLKLLTQLAEIDRKTYLPGLALCCFNIGNFHQQNKSFEKSILSYNKALSLYRELTSSYPKEYEHILGSVLNSLGLLKGEIGEQEESRILLNEALNIRRKLVKVDSNYYSSFVADTLLNISKFNEDLNLAIEAKDIYYNLIKLNRPVYLPKYASSLRNLANIYIEKQSFQNAESLYKECLGIYEELNKINPQTYSIDLAITHLNMGVFYQKCITNKALSVNFAGKAISNLLPFQNIKYIQCYLNNACNVLRHFGVNVNEYLNEKKKTNNTCQ